MGSLNRDTVIAIVLLLLCGLFYWETFSIPQFGYASMGSEVWPRLILILLAVLSAIYLVQSFGYPPGEERGGGSAGVLRTYRNPLLCFGLFFLFLITLDFLGMLLGGILFVFALLTALGHRHPRALLLHAAIAVGSVGFVWAIFTFALNVFLPQGQILRIW